MADTPPPSISDSLQRPGCLRWAVMLLIALMLTTGALVWFFLDTIKSGALWLRDLTGHLTHQQITETFRQSVTEIISTNGDTLEVAMMQTDETLTKVDMKTAFNDLLNLGTTVSEIRAPVVYRYHVRLSDPWQVSVDHGVCTVRAPALRPSLPPAIRTEGMEKKSEAGWLRFNAAENLAALEKGLTPTLEKRAGDAAHLHLIRESARKSVAEFVKNWLLKSSAQRAEPIRTISVIFPDEGKNTTPPPATLQVQ